MTRRWRPSSIMNARVGETVRPLSGLRTSRPSVARDRRRRQRKPPAELTTENGTWPDWTSWTRRYPFGRDRAFRRKLMTTKLLEKALAIQRKTARPVTGSSHRRRRRPNRYPRATRVCRGYGRRDRARSLSRQLERQDALDDRS